jgi:hypothetical protein
VQERRVLTITLKGSGRRLVRIGYVVEVPLWKTSYRLTVPEATAAGAASSKGMLQGWAIVENLTGSEWTGVDLTLVSGNPVTLRQALFRPHYVPRPEVPVDMMARVVPRVDTGAVRAAPAPFVMAPAPKPAASPPAKPAPSPAPRFAPSMSAGMAIAQPAFETSAADAATQVLFSVPEPIRLASGGTIAIPIANREVAAERVSLWDGRSGNANPLASVKLSNDTGSSLPPGLLTLYERGSKGHISYVGDARLGWFPSGENRVVSFAVDLKTQVVVDRSSAQRTATGRISRGVLQLDVFDQQTTRYTIRAPANEVRTVLIETPRLSGWTLAAPTGRDVEQTQDAYRLRMRVAPNETKDVTVVQERPIATSFALVDANYDTLLLYAKNTVLSSGVRSALENVAALRRGVDKEQEGLTELESRRPIRRK